MLNNRFFQRPSQNPPNQGMVPNRNRSINATGGMGWRFNRPNQTPTPTPTPTPNLQQQVKSGAIDPYKAGLDPYTAGVMQNPNSLNNAFHQYYTNDAVPIPIANQNNSLSQLRGGGNAIDVNGQTMYTPVRRF